MPEPDDLDGCGVDFTVAPDDDDTVEMRALFPDGIADPAKAAEWEALAVAAADAVAEAIRSGLDN